MKAFPVLRWSGKAFFLFPDGAKSILRLQKMKENFCRFGQKQYLCAAFLSNTFAPPRVEGIRVMAKLSKAEAGARQVLKPVFIEKLNL